MPDENPQRNLANQTSQNFGPEGIVAKIGQPSGGPVEMTTLPNGRRVPKKEAPFVGHPYSSGPEPAGGG